ncbi:MAG: tetratricopeptide repeat protein [Moorea sp. SIO2B7]|nr:tetratricopeptide repeat protein [Moorena sp. SIO2B7]
MYEVVETDAYRALKRTLNRRQGFGLYFVHCTPVQGEAIIEKMTTEITGKKIEVLNLEQSIDNLYNLIEERNQKKSFDILSIKGIEKSLVDYIKPGIGGEGDYYKLDTVPPLLSHLNLERERFRDNFNICMVFMVSKFVLKYLVRRAPDFFDWRSGIFEFPINNHYLEQVSSQLISEGYSRKYPSWTNQERRHRILEIKEVIDEIYQNNYNQANLWREIGLIYAASQEYEKAIASYDKALDINLDDDAAWYNRGIALGNLGRYEEALISFKKALDINPNDDAAWYNIGIALGNLGRDEEAIIFFKKALDINPDHKQTLKKIHDYDSL